MFFIFDDFMNEEMINKFEQDILEKKPIIFDTSPEFGYFPPLIGESPDTPNLDRAQKFIKEHYEYADLIEGNGWIVYEYIDPEN